MNLSDTNTTTLKEKLKKLPQSAGVYQYFDVQGNLLYVGKAKNLKNRVTSYFKTNNGTSTHGPRIAKMVSEIVDLSLILTLSEYEALLLESHLIKTLNPKYNILLRDDKSYPYIKVTEHAFPQLTFYRGKRMEARKHNENVKNTLKKLLDQIHQKSTNQEINQENVNDTKSVIAEKNSKINIPKFNHQAYYFSQKNVAGQLFGPFMSMYHVKHSLKLLHQIFQLRSCDNNTFGNRSRPCLEYQMKRCSGSCVRLISQEDYHQDVLQATDFLTGKTIDVLNQLAEKMYQFSEQENYEKAMQYRDKIRLLNQLQATQSIENEANQYNESLNIITIVSPQKSLIDQQYAIHVASVQEGQYQGGRSWILQGDDSLEVLSVLISQYYQDCDIPKTMMIQIDEDIDSALLTKEWWHDEWSWHDFVPKLYRKINDKNNKDTKDNKDEKSMQSWLKMGHKNAQHLIDENVSQKKLQQLRQMMLCRLLGQNNQTEKDTNIQWIEAFDISHQSGEATHASCVVYHDGELKPHQHQRYAINNINNGDDYAALKQAVLKRYAKAEHIPDLILIDGGKGQLNAILSIRQELGTAVFTDGIPAHRFLAITKGENRKVGLEHFIRFNDLLEIPDYQNFYPQSDDAGLLLLAQIRDEAHRVAITGMRKKRDMKRQQSVLTTIKGIGPKKKQKLLLHFGSIAQIRGASIDDIMRVAQISESLAQEIFDAVQ